MNVAVGAGKPDPNGGLRRRSSRCRTRFAPGVVGSVLLLSALVAPWPHGLVLDEARFSLVALLLVGLAVLLMAGHPVVETGGGLAIALVGVGLMQAAFGLAAAREEALAATLVFAGFLAALYATASLAADRAFVRRAASAIVVVACAQAVFGSWQWQTHPVEIYGRAVAGASPFGSFVNHNHFAGLVEMAALLAAAMALGEWHRLRVGRGVLFAGAALLLVLALVASRSRGGVVALVAGACALGCVLVPARTRLARFGLALATLGVLGGAVAVTPAATAERLASLFRGTGDGSLAYRMDALGSTAQLVLLRPVLGVGLGNFADEVTRFKSGHGDVRTTHAESDALEFLAETGLVGAALAVGFAFVLWPRARANLASTPRCNWVAHGAFGALVALGVHSLFDFNLRVPANALVACVLAGILIAPQRHPKELVARPPKAAARVVVLALLILAGLSGWHAAGAFQLTAARNEDDPQAGLARLDRVLVTHPYLAEALALRAATVLEAVNPARSPVRLAAAERDLRACVRLRPHWGEAWSNLGRVRFLRGESRAADEALARAVSLDPTHLGIGLARATFLRRAGRTDDALRELERLRDANPGLPAAENRALMQRWRSETESR